MVKKRQNFFYPDLRRLALFFLIVVISLLLWVNVLVNSLPVMIIGTHEFENTFCDIKLTAANCNLNTSQIYSTEATLNQTIDNLNTKYSQFSDLNVNFEVAEKIIPSGALSCLLNQNVVNLMNNNAPSQNFNILAMTSSCNSQDIFVFIINFVVIYVLICGFFWVYDKRYEKK